MKGHELRLSLDVASRHVIEAFEMGADAIVSACGTCKKNFQHAIVQLRKKGMLTRKVSVYDLTELMAKRVSDNVEFVSELSQFLG
jgi:heterodisulfide reductase subunit B